MNPIEDFINLFYKEKLNEFGMKWPDKQTFNIDFNDVERYDIELSKKIIDDPINILGEFEGVLRKWTFPYEVCNWNPRVGFYNTKHGVAIRDMRCEHINTLISVSGLVQKITIVYPKLVIASFECMRCGHVTYVVQIDNRYIEPLECEGELCGRKGPFKLLHKESTFYDTQKLRVQESPEDLTGGDQPQTTDIEICGDMTGNILPGNRINVTGILQSFQKISQTHGKTNQFELMVNGIHVQHHDIEMKIELTEQDKEDIETFSKQKNVAAKLSDLFATSIYGYEEIKEAILVSSVSGENTIKSDGTLQRGYTNLLICGDPSTAKSTLLTALKQIIPQSQFATGDGSTKAGLTAAVVKDDFSGGKWTLEAGALVLADKSVAIIDELDKISSDQITQLNTSLSSNTVFINKAGINSTLWTRCPIICAMNPKSGRFDPDETLASQVKLRPDTLSRFDLVFLMRDIPSENVDSNIADILIGSWCADSSTKNNDFIKKYMYVASKIKYVEVNLEAKKLIKNYYLGIRSDYDSKSQVIPITSRNLEALLRLTRAEAKLRLSDKANVSDAQRAINLLDKSRDEIYLNDDGVFDSDRVECVNDSTQRDKIKKVKDIISSIEGGIKYSDIVLSVDYTKKNLDAILKEMISSGYICEPNDKFYKAV